MVGEATTHEGAGKAEAGAAVAVVGMAPSFERLRAMGIRDKPIAPGLPRQNGFAETDRIDPTRVRRPCDRLGRGAPTPDSASLCPVLQRSENIPLVGQRCAILAPRSAERKHHVTGNPRRAASPLHASLSFRYTHAPLRRAVQRSGTIITTPILSGLHHRYARI